MSFNIVEIMIEVLKELVKPLSPTINYEYFDDFNYENSKMTNIDGRFSIEINRTRTETTSIALSKDKQRDIIITYIYPYNIVNNSLSTILWFENILDSLVKDERIKREVREINYDYDIELLKNNENDIAGMVKIKTNISLIERRKQNASFNR